MSYKGSNRRIASHIIINIYVGAMTSLLLGDTILISHFKTAATTNVVNHSTFANQCHLESIYKHVTIHHVHH